MSFKFLRGDDNLTFRLEPIQQLALTRHRFVNVEFCFQFDDEEPVVFANGSNECHIRLENTEEGYMTFTDNNGKVFKLFAREGQNG